VTALYEVKLGEGTEGQLAEVFLRWQDPETKEVTEISRSIGTTDLAASFGSSSQTFKLAVMVAEFAEILRESYWAQEFTLADIIVKLDSQDWPQFQQEEILEFEDLVRKAAGLR
jgi:Ca-activated chloride channel family protein